MNKKSIFTKIYISFVMFMILFNVAFLALFIGYYFQQQKHAMKTILKNRDTLENKQLKEPLVLEGFTFSPIAVEDARNTLTILPVDKFGPPPPPKMPEGFPERKIPEHERFETGMPQESDRFPPPGEHGRFMPHEVTVIHGVFQTVFIKKERNREFAIKITSNGHFYLYSSLLYLFLLLVATAFYYSIIKNLKPLKQLAREIEAFGRGEMPRPVSENMSENEIGRIQNAFYNAAHKIQTLNEAREIFLTNAAHELKTPVAKGVVATHLLEERKEKKWLLDIFSRMEELIQELVMAEEVYAREFKPLKEEIRLVPFYENLRERLYMNPEILLIEGDPDSLIHADRKLMEIAVSNLMDNGVKFADDNKAICIAASDQIIVKNRGEALKEDIEKYCAPFYKETSIRNEHGNGLGLYLTKRVLDIQGLKLEYQHEEGWNIFSITQ